MHNNNSFAYSYEKKDIRFESTLMPTLKKLLQCREGNKMQGNNIAPFFKIFCLPHLTDLIMAHQGVLI